MTGAVVHLLSRWLGSKKTLRFADYSIYYTHKKVTYEYNNRRQALLIFSLILIH